MARFRDSSDLLIVFMYVLEGEFRHTCSASARIRDNCCSFLIPCTEA